MDRLLIVCLSLTFCLHDATAQGLVDSVMPQAVVIEPATPGAISIRWPIVGDRNLNATIAVAYRKSGSAEWSHGYPLFRTFNERLSPDNVVPDGHLFAGSVVGLEPGTAYELRLELHDADGGSTSRVLVVTTAAELRLPRGMTVRYVLPLGRGKATGGTGTAADPYRGLQAALRLAEAGDVLSLAPGTYADAPFVLQTSGTRDLPIVITGAADGAAVLDGRGGELLLDLSGRAHVWIDRLTLRGANRLLQANLASFITATRNHFEIMKWGFVSRGAVYREAVGFRLSDNTFVGGATWPRSRGVEEFYAIAISGSGHVVSYNLIRNVGDGIHNGGDGRLSATDIHNNDIDVCTDDGIEADYSDTNVRIFQNRITNCFSGISLQPVRGGPVYVFRNTMLNLQYSPFKLHNDTAGILLFHNTSIKAGVPFSIATDGETVRDVVTRNNLFVGTSAPALSSNGQMSRTDFDNDGFDWPAHGAFAIWNGRPYDSARAARAAGAVYRNFGAVEMGPQLTFAGPVPAPRVYSVRIDPAAHNPQLAPASRAIDRGIRLPNFNDAYSGLAPDLGCCEAGHDLPWFGPRPHELHRLYFLESGG